MADYVGKISNTLYHAADFSAFEPALLRIFGVRGTKIFRAYWLAITKILFVFLFYLCACAYYTQKEGWTVSEAIYFITVTTSTVGYGVLHPTSEASKVFTIFLIIFGIFFILPIANIFAVNIGVHLQNRILSHVRSYFPSENAWISHLNRGAVSITSILACLILGIIVYSANENWSFVTACYFTVITMSTVGYGDVVPTKESTQWFTVFFIILCVLVFATALNTFGVIYGDLMLVRRRNNVFKKDVNIARLEELSNRPQGIDKFDFVVEILTQLELVNKTRDIEPLIRKFEELDKSGLGFLTSDNLKVLKLHEFTPKQSLSGSNGGGEAEVTTIHLDGTPLNEAGRGHGRNDTSSSSVSAAGKVIPVSILMTSSHDDEEEEEERKSSGFQKSSEYVGVLKGEGNPMHGGKAASSSYYSDGTPAKQSRKPEGGPSALIGNQQPPRGFVGDDDKYFIV